MENLKHTAFTVTRACCTTTSDWVVYRSQLQCPEPITRDQAFSICRNSDTGTSVTLHVCAA